ncbi:ABC transporter substrate-binding protein [Georgenia sp. AZ-5]|uniref:ABC transporter substrate-binding protein n=1 Tax=Georgenia sp. AZ-5 TaxID=3367526 RepID=UPI0037550B32
MKKSRLAAVGVAAALGLAACTAPADRTTEERGGASEPAENGAGGAGRATIGLTYTPDIQFAPFYVAEERGYYEEAGVDVTLRHHGQSEGLFSAIGSGEEDVVVAGGDEMLQARAQAEPVPLKSVATLYQQYPVVLIVPADSGITSAADLEGRSVGIPGPFGETYFGLLALLRSAGLTEDDVDVQHIGYTQQSALQAGHVDAVMGYVNNDAVRFAQAGMDVRTIEIPPAEDGNVPLVGVSIGVLDSTAAERPEDVAAVVAASLRGVQDVLDDPEAAVDVATGYIPDLARPEQREAALATLDATAPLYEGAAGPGRHDGARWEQMVTFLSEHGLLESEVDASEAWTDEFVPGTN